MGECHKCNVMCEMAIPLFSLHVRKRLIKAFFISEYIKGKGRQALNRTERRIHREREKGAGNGNGQDGQVLASKQEWNDGSRFVRKGPADVESVTRTLILKLACCHRPYSSGTRHQRPST